MQIQSDIQNTRIGVENMQRLPPASEPNFGPLTTAQWIGFLLKEALIAVENPMVPFRGRLTPRVLVNFIPGTSRHLTTLTSGEDRLNVCVHAGAKFLRAIFCY